MIINNRYLMLRQSVLNSMANDMHELNQYTPEGQQEVPMHDAPEVMPVEQEVIKSVKVRYKTGMKVEQFLGWVRGDKA